MRCTIRIILIILLGLNTACTTPMLRDGAVAGTTPQAVQRQILVTLTNTTPSQLARKAADLAESYQLRQVAAWPITVLDIHCFIYEIAPQHSASMMVKALRADPSVESAQLMNLFEVMSYNDPYLNLQNNVEHTPIEKVHRWTTGKGIKIAIVDSGVDTQHPDLHQQIAESKNFVGNNNADGVNPVGDIHGTAVAGIIVAKPNNLIGIVGVAPDAEIMALKACWPRTPGSSKALCNSFTLARALNVAIQKEVDIINLSLAGPKDPLLTRIIQVALKQSICVVAADSDDQLTRRFPAELPGVIGVHSLSLANEKIHLKKQGAATKLAAPGTDILTTVPKDSYDFMSGSSLATASVSAVVALMLQQNPKLSPEQIHQILLTSARPSQKQQGDITANTEKVIDICAAITQIAGKDICL